MFAVALPLSIGGLATALELLHGVGGLKPAAVQPSTTEFSVHLPPSDTQLLWLSRNGEQVPDAVRLHAFDWNGHQVGTLALPCQAPCGIHASPDGERILVSQLGQTAQQLPGGPALLVEDGGAVFDSRGGRIGAVGGGFPNLSVAWADDSRHLCITHGLKDAASTGGVQLDLVDPAASASRIVTTFVDSGSLPIEVLACSPSVDRAVLLALSDGCVQEELDVVQLSTGRILLAHSYPSTPDVCAASPVVRHDSAVAFEPTATGGTVVRDLIADTIEPLATGSSASVDVSGLSWNARRLITTAGVIAAGGGFVWTAAPGDRVSLLAARPRSDDVFLLISKPGGAGDRRVIVRSDGSEFAVPFPLDA